MFSIPPVPVVSNSHKRHRTDVDNPLISKPSKAETRSTAQKQPKSAPLAPPGISLLNKLTSVVVRHMVEWLDETTALRLMEVGKKYRDIVLSSYGLRLKPPFYRACPTPIAYAYNGDRLAQWIVVENSVRLQPGNEIYPASRSAVVLRHQGGPGDYACEGYRPPCGPRWKIQRMSTSSTWTGNETTYHATVKPLGEEAQHAVLLYRDPRNRRERHIATDDAGMAYLAAKHIYRPLSARIGAGGGMTVAMAEKFINAQRQWIAAELISGRLSKQQCEAFKNPLFSEQLECRRIDRPTALQLAGDDMNLFYCLSLLPLFRAGTIQLSALSEMSEHGIRLLHDPRLVKLLRTGLLNEQQVKTLTQTQYRILLLLYQPLQRRQLSAQDALQLTLKQALEHLEPEPQSPLPVDGQFTMAPADVASLISVWPAEKMRKAPYGPNRELDLEWIAAYNRVSKFLPSLQDTEIFRVALFSISSSSSSSSSFSSSSSSSSMAPPSLTRSDKSMSTDRLWLSKSEAVRHKERSTEEAGVAATDVALLLSRMPSAIVRNLIFADGWGGNADWVSRFGKIIHLMPVEKITEFLNTQQEYQDSPDELFNMFGDGLTGKKPQAVAVAFNQIFIDLAGHVDAENYLKLAEMFLDNLLGFMVSWSWRCECPAIIDQCREIWSLVQSRCELTGDTVDRYRDLAVEILLEAPAWGHGFSGVNGTEDENTMAAFASLLVAMGLTDNEDFLKVWTDATFSEPTVLNRFDQEDRENWRRVGLATCHAIFTPLRESEYGSVARRYMSMALGKSAESLN